jgi:hypothetical protein
VSSIEQNDGGSQLDGSEEVAPGLVVAGARCSRRERISAVRRAGLRSICFEHLGPRGAQLKSLMLLSFPKETGCSSDTGYNKLRPDTRTRAGGHVDLSFGLQVGQHLGLI